MGLFDVFDHFGVFWLLSCCIEGLGVLFCVTVILVFGFCVAAAGFWCFDFVVWVGVWIRAFWFVGYALCLLGFDFLGLLFSGFV